MGMTGLFCILTWSEWNPKEQEAWPPEIHLLLLEWLFYFSMLYFPIYKMGTTTQTYQLKESRTRNGSNARTDLYLAPFCFRWNLQTALGRDNSVPLSGLQHWESERTEELQPLLGEPVTLTLDWPRQSVMMVHWWQSMTTLRSLEGESKFTEKFAWKEQYLAKTAH